MAFEDIRLRFRSPVAPQPSGAQRDFHLDIDTRLPGRGITGIFGRSGAGKTTLLRCIAGLHKVRGGLLQVCGDTWQDGGHFLPVHRRPLGYVFQESSLLPHLTARANLEYAAKRARDKSAQSQGPVDRVVSLMGIESLLERYPHQLSGGERQRVAIARALLTAPRLLLMDEPLASLDLARKHEILPYLERMRAESDIPILYVSHSVDEMARLADHLLLLDGGSVVAQGDLPAVFSRLDLPGVPAEEIGAVLEGHIEERDSQWGLARIRFDGGELWLRDGGGAPGQKIRVRVLARDLSLALSAREDTSILNRLPMQIVEMAPDSDAAMLLVRLKAGESTLVARLTRRSAAHLALAPGKRVWAQIKSAAIVQ